MYNFPPFGALAQLVEHRTFNPLVERSSRSRPTTHHKAYKKCEPFYFYKKQQTN